MRHSNRNKKFGRETNVRAALMKSLAVALVTKEKITTTLPKAKALRPWIEKLVTNAKPGTIASRRLVASRIGVRTGKKVSDVIGPKYAKVAGGYTRITKIGTRMSDGAPMAVIEFV